jgi:hypothetical protein
MRHVAFLDSWPELSEYQLWNGWLLVGWSPGLWVCEQTWAGLCKASFSCLTLLSLVPPHPPVACQPVQVRPGVGEFGLGMVLGA